MNSACKGGILTLLPERTTTDDIFWDIQEQYRQVQSSPGDDIKQEKLETYHPMGSNFITLDLLVSDEGGHGLITAGLGLVQPS